MEWQDLVLAAGSAVFAIALIPTVFSPGKPALSTSLMTGLTLAVFAVTYQTLGLAFASITTVVSALLWLTIATQTILARR